MALALAMLAVTSEMSIAAVALPSIGTDLAVSPAATAWVLLACSLPMAAIAIPAGRWSDRVDPRAIFALSLVGVGVTSVLAAVAPAFWFLLVSRLLLGLAGGLTLVVYMPIIAAAVRPDQRGRAVSFVVTVMTVGGMAGASLGGVAAGAFGWRSVFLLKLPVLVVALWLGLRSMPGSGRGLSSPDRSMLVEAALLGGAIAALSIAVDRALTSPVLAALLAGAAIVLAVGWTRLPASGPMLELVRVRAFGAAVGGLFLLVFNGALMVFLMPYFLTDVVGEGPDAIGVLLLVNIGAMALVSPVSGWLADRYGALRIATAGAALTTAVTLLLLGLGPDAGLLDIGWRMAVLGAAFGLFNAPIITAIMDAAPAGATGAAGGVSGAVRTTAMTVAPAVTAVAWTAAGSGEAGFRTAVVVLAVIQAAGVLVLLTGRRR